MKQKSKLWIISRIGILLVFGIMLPMQTCYRLKLIQDLHKYDTFYKYSDMCDKAYQKANLAQVGSPEWNKAVEEHNMWLGKMQREKIRVEASK